MVGEGGQLPLPWLRATLDEVLQHQRGHALLLQGAPGHGAFEFALTLAQAWLCEAVSGPRPCGACAGCRLVQSKTHPDLNLRLPEEMAVEREWPVLLDANRKPSKQIRIVEIRQAIDWIITTPARGRAKVLVLYPAEAMNEAAASALLKTLEEPPPGARVLICAAEPARLMPTVRSRCQTVQLPVASTVQATAWLASQGLGGTADVAEAAVLLAAAGGRPLDALVLHRGGVTAQSWAALPQRVARGDATALAGWSVPAALDALMKLSHDASIAAAGGAPRYFPADAVPRTARLERLATWHKTLQRVKQHAEHPWQEALAIEALVAEGCDALTAAVPGKAPGRKALDTLDQ